MKCSDLPADVYLGPYNDTTLWALLSVFPPAVKGGRNGILPPKSGGFVVLSTKQSNGGSVRVHTTKEQHDAIDCEEWC